MRSIPVRPEHAPNPRERLLLLHDVPSIWHASSTILSIPFGSRRSRFSRESPRRPDVPHHRSCDLGTRDAFQRKHQNIEIPPWGPAGGVEGNRLTSSEGRRKRES